MNRKLKIVYGEWIFSIIAWIAIMYLYFYIVFWGASDTLKEGPVKDYILSWHPHLEILLQGLVFGLFFGIINTITERTAIRRKSFGFIIFVKSVMYVFAMAIAALSIYLVFIFFQILTPEVFDSLMILLTPRYVLSFIVYLLFGILLLNFLFVVNKKFGPGNLIKLITGKYQKPREEKRIFLFLDLKDSTTIAEKLGHKRYSQLLRNCFHDVTDIVIKYKAEVYQYVGDEIVLSWKIKDGFKDLNCIKTYFAFQKKLISKKEKYLTKFEILPEFKGGMDMGFVTVTEIGDIKREIAFHGDVVNTASRIQKQCKVLHHSLLISENLEKNIIQLNGFEKNYIGEVKLKGKQKDVRVFSVDLVN